MEYLAKSQCIFMCMKNPAQVLPWPAISFLFFFLSFDFLCGDKFLNIKHLIGFNVSSEGGTHFSSYSTFCTVCICTCSRTAQCQWWRGLPGSRSRREPPPPWSSPCSLRMDSIQLALPIKTFNTDRPHSTRGSNSARYFMSDTNYELSMLLYPVGWL